MTSKARTDALDLTFLNHHAAFKSKTTWEVIRAYVVFQLCSIQPLVANNEKVNCCQGDQMIGKNCLISGKVAKTGAKPNNAKLKTIFLSAYLGENIINL